MGFGAPVGHDVDGVADHVGHGGPQVLGGTVGFTWRFFLSVWTSLKEFRIA